MTRIPLQYPPTAGRWPSWLRSWQQQLGSVTLTWMAVCAGLHLFFLIGINGFHSTAITWLYDEALSLSPANLAAGKVWTLLTYAGLHDLGSILHSLGNLLGWYWFGPQAERALGKRSYIRLTLAAVVVGGLLQVGWEALSGRDVGVVGSSAAVMALLAHFAWSHPDARVLLFFVLPVRTQHLVPILLGLDALLALTGSPVAVFAHAGGVLAAWYLVRAGGNPRIAWTRLKLQVLRVAASKKTRRPNLTVLTGGRHDPFRNHPDRNRPDRWN